jgi:hypothetical protein
MIERAVQQFTDGQAWTSTFAAGCSRIGLIFRAILRMRQEPVLADRNRLREGRANGGCRSVNGANR